MAATELPTPGKFDSGCSAPAQGRPGAIWGQIGQKKIANPIFFIVPPWPPLGPLKGHAYYPFKGPAAGAKPLDK